MNLVVLLFACSEGFGLSEAVRPRERPTDTGPAGGDSADDTGDVDPAESGGAGDTAEGVETAETTDTGADDSGVAPMDVAFWTLGERATAWDAWEDAGGAHAPTAPIEAAFALGEVGRVWVLTRSTWHVMLLADRSWIDSGDRDSLFPEAAGEELRVAASIPAAWGDGLVASVYLITADTALLYDYTLASRAFSPDTQVAIDWSADPDAPNPARLSIAWLAVDEAAGWASPGSPADECGADSDTLGPYVAYVDDRGTAFLWDAGWCFTVTTTLDANDLSVFTYADAPDPGALAAIDWTGDELIAFPP